MSVSRHPFSPATLQLVISNTIKALPIFRFLNQLAFFGKKGDLAFNPPNFWKVTVLFSSVLTQIVSLLFVCFHVRFCVIQGEKN